MQLTAWLIPLDCDDVDAVLERRQRLAHFVPVLVEEARNGQHDVVFVNHASLPGSVAPGAGSMRLRPGGRKLIEIRPQRIGGEVQG
jgi:hypothetical protein